MRHSKATGQPSSSAPSAYSPSVPISLYREVTSELQTTKAELETLKTHNRQLLQQNQQLRQEIERLAQVALHSQQAISHMPMVPQDSPVAPLETWVEGTLAMPVVASPATPARKPRPQPLPERSNKNWVIEHPTPSRRVQAGTPSSTDDRPIEMSGWKLGLVIVLITLTAFGAGFLLVRPLLSSSHAK